MKKEKDWLPDIKKLMRIVDHQKSSLIDNIFINTIEKHIKSGNLTTKVSDHLPNFIIVSNTIDKIKHTKKSQKF